ncbi:hypothetical protein WJX73_007006 [Symbiochloris irregularis]|uniref:Transcription initiation factor TFIID component TAF4 C-terminal domain-containing protein n=1 Tax=Symbiochloris irregularis TaxID=706552 RepID=A0AAW1PG51_9CHLO
MADFTSLLMGDDADDLEEGQEDAEALALMTQSLMAGSTPGMFGSTPPPQPTPQHSQQLPHQQQPQQPRQLQHMSQADFQLRINHLPPDKQKERMNTFLHIREQNRVRQILQRFQPHVSDEKLKQITTLLSNQLKARQGQGQANGHEGKERFHAELLALVGRDVILKVPGFESLGMQRPPQQQQQQQPGQNPAMGMMPQIPAGSRGVSPSPHPHGDHHPQQQHPPRSLTPAIPAQQAGGIQRQPPLQGILAGASHPAAHQAPRPPQQGVTQQQPPAPSQGVKRAAEAPPAGQPGAKKGGGLPPTQGIPPASAQKKEKDGKFSREDEFDILKGMGISMELEDEAANLRPSAQARGTTPQVAPPEQLCLEEQVLIPKLQQICRRHGVEEIASDLHVYLSRATALHIGELLKAAADVAQQRRDVNKRLPGMTTDGCSNVMQQLAVIRKRDQEEAKAVAESKAAAEAAAAAAEKPKQASKAEAAAKEKPVPAPVTANLTKSNWKAMAKGGRAGASAAAAKAAHAKAGADAKASEAAAKPSGAEADKAKPVPKTQPNETAQAQATQKAALPTSLLPRSRLDESAKLLVMRDLVAAMRTNRNYSHSPHLSRFQLAVEHAPPT